VTRYKFDRRFVLDLLEIAALDLHAYLLIRRTLRRFKAAG
jgi:hypothetical protein